MAESKNRYSAERARPIGNFSGRALLVRTLVDLKLASIYYSIQRRLKQATGSILEVGCGNAPYRFLIKNASYTGIDHAIAAEFSYKKNSIIYYEGDDFPVKNNSFDIVFHTEVLEHVAAPSLFMENCYKTLKPGGAMFFTVPFNYRFHYIPHDYYRYTPSSLKILCEKAGFSQIAIKAQGTDITVACYKIISVFFRLAKEKRPFLRKIANIVICLIFSPILIIAHSIGWLSLVLMIGSCDDTLGYFVECKKD